MTQPDTTSPQWKSWLESHVVAVAATGAVALLAAIVLGVVALGGSDTGEQPTAPPTTQTSAPASSTGTSSPITATTAPGAAAGEGLIAVKIDNAPAARPQIGLGSARYLFEVPVEGGLTRFLGLYSPNDVLVGPVRSLRPVDVDLIPALSDTVVATGGRPFVIAPLEANGVSVLGFDDTASVLQSLERPRPHNLFVNLSQFQVADHPPGLPTGDLPPPTDTAETITVPYASPVSWIYEDSGYARSDAGEPTMFLPEYEGSPAPLVATTVVVMSVGERRAGYTDVNGAEVPDFDVIGSGALVVFNQGQVFGGRWSRASLSEPYEFTTPQGDEFGLPGGLVYIHLLASDLQPDF
jgi:hypothetical protein